MDISSLMCLCEYICMYSHMHACVLVGQRLTSLSDFPQPQCACILTTTCHARSGVEFPTCGLLLVGEKKFWIFLGFMVFALERPELFQ